MAKFSTVHYFFLVLLAFAAVEMMVQTVNAEKCEERLSDSGCVIASCQQQCYEQKKGTGECVGGVSGGDYACVCIFDCQKN